MESFQSEDITKLAQALLKVQKDLPAAKKDEINSYTKAKYASLNSIMEA